MMRLHELVEFAALEGVSVMFKIDGERDQNTGNPWTVVLGSPHFGECPSRRGDFKRIDSAIGWAQGTMAGLPGDWSWLGDHVDVRDLAAMDEVFGELGRAGFVAILDYHDSLWSLSVNGPTVGSFPTLEECLICANVLT